MTVCTQTSRERSAPWSLPPPPSRETTSGDAGLTVTLSSLAAAFATVPDPRRQASVTYPLPAVLAQAVSAILCAHVSVLAIAEWGARQSGDLLCRLGFPAGRAPCQSTLHRLFRKLDARALAGALRVAFDAPADRRRGEQGVALDGKAQRGRRQYEELPGSVHALAAFCQEQGLVLVEEPIEHPAEQAEAELTVAPRVIEQLDWQGRVLTGDALYCQRALCQQVLDRGGDYLLTVKGNRSTLHRLLMLDRYERVISLGKRLAGHAPASALQSGTWLRTDVSRQWESDPHEMVIAAYLFGELPAAPRSDFVDRLWSLVADTLVFVEPGTPHGIELVRQARDQLRGTGPQDSMGIRTSCQGTLTCGVID